MYVHDDQQPLLAGLGADGEVTITPAPELLPRGTQIVIPGGTKLYTPGRTSYVYTTTDTAIVVLQMDAPIRAREGQPDLLELATEVDIKPLEKIDTIETSGHGRKADPSETYKLRPGTDVTVLASTPPIVPGDPPLLGGPPAAPWYQRPRFWVSAVLLVGVSTIAYFALRNRSGGSQHGLAGYSDTQCDSECKRLGFPKSKVSCTCAKWGSPLSGR